MISPTLFNIAMHHLPRRLADVPGLKYAVYADDVTKWAPQGSPDEQEDVLQRALESIHDYATEHVYTPHQTKPSLSSYMVGDQPLSNGKKSGLLNFTLVIDP